MNPVARSNVCPWIDPPTEPAFHAFSFTMPATEKAPSFVIAGSAEAKRGRGELQRAHRPPRRDALDAMREKARHVLAEMERRLAALGFTWADTTATEVYTVHDLYPFLADEIVRRGAVAHSGLTWHYARPPVEELEFEMDCRAISGERIV